MTNGLAKENSQLLISYFSPRHLRNKRSRTRTDKHPRATTILDLINQNVVKVGDLHLPQFLLKALLSQT